MVYYRGGEVYLLEAEGINFFLDLLGTDAVFTFETHDGFVGVELKHVFSSLTFHGQVVGFDEFNGDFFFHLANKILFFLF